MEKEGSGEPSGKRWGRRAVSGALICITGGVALSAFDDLAIYHACSGYRYLFNLYLSFSTV